jgi:hypothetical protein
MRFLIIPKHSVLLLPYRAPPSCLDVISEVIFSGD